MTHFEVKADEALQENNRFNEAGSDMFALMIMRQKFGLTVGEITGVMAWRSKASDKSHDTQPWLKEFLLDFSSQSRDLSKARTFESASELSMQLVDTYRARFNK